MKQLVKTYYPFLPLILLCAFYACRAMAFPIHDFSNYYFAGKLLATGNFDSEMYFPYQFNKAISDLGYHGIFASYAPNSPFLALLFVPFSLTSVMMAKLVFNLISIGLFVFSLCRIFSLYRLNPKMALLIPLLFFVPIKNSLLFGQVYFLLFFLLAEGWIAYEKERWKPMAAFWALAILLKVFPVFLVLLLLFKKRGKALLYLGLSCLSFGGVSLIFTGTDIWIFYLREVLPKASNGEIATAFVDNYQSVLMFLKRCFVYDSFENPSPFAQASSFFTVTVFAFKMGVLSLCFFISRKERDGFYTFSFWTMAMLLLSPYGSTYTFMLAVFPFLALVKSELSNVKKAVLFGMLFLICNLSLSLFLENQFPYSYLRLFLLLAFTLGFVLFEYQKATLIKAFVVSGIIFFIGTFFEQQPPHKSEAVAIEGSPTLMYDYEINGKKLTYWYWNEKGAEKASMLMDNYRLKSLEIKNNQVFQNDRQLTFDKSHKIKPVVINDTTLIYLSDYGRGIGFYTLRKFNIP